MLKTLRNNWKKSVFGFAALSYGTYYLIDRKQRADLMQAYCYEALKNSKKKIKPEQIIRRVTIFLNPIANRERGKYVYDKNVAPLLNLSGLDLRVIRLEKNSDANEYMKEIDMNDTDLIVVAGGNATLNEVIKGLVDRPDSSEFLKRIPIGILPIGETNTFAKKWFHLHSTKSEDEVRLFADAAIAILKGNTEPVDLLKITLNKNVVKHEDDEGLEMKKKGAYSLIKDNKIYALSTYACGFVTITDANEDKYWYFGFKWLKNKMNLYFTERFLRRNPFKYHFSYKLKCDGCSKCLNKEELTKKLLSLEKGEVDNKVEVTDPNASLMQRFLKKLKSINKSLLTPKKKQPTPQEIELAKKKMKKLKFLIEKSDLVNDDCDKLHETYLTQVQLISNINEPNLSDEDINTKYIDTVVVKDPQFNPKEMFLASRKQLKEYELKKLNSGGLDKKYSSFNYFAIEIDGEIYKLHNSPEDDLHIHVELIENCINLLKVDADFTNSVKASYLPKIYSLSKRTLEEYFYPKKKVEGEEEMPPIQPFEALYLKYCTWNPFGSTNKNTE